MSDSRKTLDPNLRRTLQMMEGEHPKTPSSYEVTNHFPGVEVLYHYDLDCIGLVTPPELFLSGEQVTFGREHPFFMSLTEPLSQGRTLKDPCVSRNQLQLRWMAGLGCFEISVPSRARRPVCTLRGEPDDSGLVQPVMERISGKRLVYPGEIITVGDRAIFMLTYRPFVGNLDRMGMIGEELCMWHVRWNIRTSARFRRPVLIYGETGTGKELAARALHACSERGTRPMQVVNCAALPENLVESILFGHNKGAFTGAEGDRPGHFRAADRSSIFLDEIGELPMGTQQRLLRTLQENTVTPVGSVQEIEVDARCIAATNRDLAQEVNAGRFRADLYYRIAAHRLSMPPLRERRGDIPRLFVHFLREQRNEYQELSRLWRPVDAFQPPIPMSFFAELLVDPWLGNVRQLQNVVESTAQVNLRKGRFVLPTWRMSAVQPSGPVPIVPNNPTVEPEPAAFQTEDTFDGPYDMVLQRIVEHLNVSRSTLRRLLSPKEVSMLHHKTQAGALEDAVQHGVELVSNNLAQILERHGYNQTHVANELELSRTTLIRVMRILGFTRARDLSAQDIQAALMVSQGDHNQAARALRVSARGLRLRRSELNI